jgi:hypothetical protein
MGRLEHVGHIIPTLRHFMSRIRHLKDKAKEKGLHYVSLGTVLVDDLGLHLKFLHYANSGISTNLLTYRLPDVHYRSDTCPFGMGGYSLISGRAWRIETPDDLLFHMSLNTLEFLTCVIYIWLDIIEGCSKPEDCLLSQPDSTPAAGWLRKSNFNDKDQLAKMLLSRKLAEILLTSEACLCPQCFLGSTTT